MDFDGGQRRVVALPTRGSAMAMPRVCHLTNVHSLWDQRVFYREAQSLRAAGYEVTLVGPGSVDDAGCRAGVRIVTIPRPASPVSRMANLGRLLRESLATGAPLFHLHDPELLPLGVLLRALGKKVIYDCHEHFAQTALVRSWVPKLLSRPLAGLIDVGEPLAARLLSGVVGVVDEQGQRFRGVPYVTVKNFPRLEWFPCPEGGPPAGDPWILHIGTLSPDRGSLFLLELMRELVTTHPRARLRHIGIFHSEGDRRDFHALLARYGLQDHVVCQTERVPYDRLAEAIAGHRVGLLPTMPAPPNLMPFLPTKLFEYLACGLPVVASALPPIEAIEGAREWGILAPPGDAPAYAAAIGRLLDDPGLAAAKGARGRALAESTFNWQAEADKLARFYGELLGQDDAAHG